MKVIILDRHPSNDARLERHMTTLRENGVVFHRYRLPRHDKSVPQPHEPELQGIIRTPIHPKSQILFQILQRLACLFPSTLMSVSNEGDVLNRSIEKMIIHVHDPELLGLAKHLKKKYSPSARIVYDRHEVYESAGGLYGKIARFFEHVNKKSVDGVVGISSYYNQTNKALFPNSIVCAIPNYPFRSDYDTESIENKIESIGESEDIVLSYVGSLNYHYDRDVDLLIDVFANALELRNKVKVIIAGNPPTDRLDERLKMMVAEYDGRFEYRGFVSRDEAVSISEMTHVGFFLLRPESKYWVKSSPNKLFEYLCTGTIAIVRAEIDADIGPENALIFNRYADRDSIILEVMELLKDEKRMQRMMSSAYELGKRYSYEEVQNRYIDMYDQFFSYQIQTQGQ